LRRFERNERSSAPVAAAGSNTTHPRQPSRKSAFTTGLLEAQFERSWTARPILDSDARAERTKSFEQSSAKLNNSGTSLQVSPIASKKVTSMHNRETKRIGG